MTVQDLLRHTSGLIYGGRGASLVNQAYVAAKIGDRSMSNQEFVTKLSSLPLRFSPGARWEYGVSTDVLGRLVEVVDGKTLGEALSERIFKPLGMVDTQFQVPAAKVARAAQPGPRPGGQPMTARFKVDDGAKYESGGGGLTSHDGRLPALRVHAGERRRAERQAPDRQADAGLHGGRPYRARDRAGRRGWASGWASKSER